MTRRHIEQKLEHPQRHHETQTFFASLRILEFARRSTRLFFFFKQKTAYEISRDWSSDVCSSDLRSATPLARAVRTKSCPSTSSMLLRVKRATIAEIARPSDAAAGNIVTRLRTAFSVNGTCPRVGSHG